LSEQGEPGLVNRPGSPSRRLAAQANDSEAVSGYPVAMKTQQRPTRDRRPRALALGLILLLLLGAPLNLALPDAMAGMAPSGAATIDHQGSNCPEPASSRGDHAPHHDHSSLCLFCTALGGPSLAGASLDLASRIAPLPTVSIVFDLSDTERLASHPTRIQCCRGPPATV
jgi:hypothetical protein